MARSPVLVWRNVTRIRLITAFRTAQGAPDDQLIPGEPLICDGIELPLKHRKKRIDLEARGLIKGAQVIYLGPGSKDGFRQAARHRCRGTAGLSRRDHQDREAGRGGAVHPLGRAHGGRLSARCGGDDPQGAGQPMGRRAGVLARPVRGRPDRAGPRRAWPCGSGWPMSPSRGPRNGCIGWCATGWRCRPCHWGSTICRARPPRWGWRARAEAAGAKLFEEFCQEFSENSWRRPVPPLGARRGGP